MRAAATKTGTPTVHSAIASSARSPRNDCREFAIVLIVLLIHGLQWNPGDRDDVPLSG